MGKKKKKSKTLWDRIRRNPAAIEDILGGLSMAFGGGNKTQPNNEDARKSGFYKKAPKVSFTSLFNQDKK